MKLRDSILKEHSRKNCHRIVYWVGGIQERFDQLFQLFLGDDYRVVQRAAWPLSYCVEAHPRLISKHLGKLISNLKKQGLHNAVKRNSVRLLQFIEIPVGLHGDLMNICFSYIADPDEKPAVKAFSLGVLQKLSSKYPEIKNELKLIINERWEYESAAFRSRGRKILREC